MNKFGSTIVFYNARLVDSCIDSPGVVVVCNGRIAGVFLGEVTDSKAALKIAEPLIQAAGSQDKPELYDAKALTLMPSFIDMHVHFRYPGQTQKEDLDSGINAAVAGGFGTVVCMPNTKPVVSTKKLAQSIMAEAAAKHKAQVFQTVSITKDFSGEDITELDNITRDQFPVISEDGRDVTSAAVMLGAMKKAGKKGIVVACHCEDLELGRAAAPYRQRALGFMRKYNIPAGDVNAKTPDVPDSVNFEIDGNLTAANKLLALAEDTATERNIELAKAAGCHVHICHCSTAVSIDAVRRAKNLIREGKITNGFDCTVEITPHHFGLVGTDAPYIRALVNPPLRSEEDRSALIAAIRDGTVDVISTDHAPHTQEDKAAGSPGFTGLEVSFAVANTVLVNKEGFSLNKISELMSANPAKILKINSGRLVPGLAANLVIVDPQEVWTVDSSKFYSKGKSTPLAGKTLVGRVKATFFAGNRVYTD